MKDQEAALHGGQGGTDSSIQALPDKIATFYLPNFAEIRLGQASNAW
jgi:hypothetical protein